MRTCRVLLHLVLLAAWGCQSDAGDASRDIAAVMEDQKDAWNRGDIEAFMRGYWHSPDVLFASRGTFERGWQPLLERYQRNYPDGGTGVLEFSDITVHPIDDDHAWVTGQWALAMDGGSPHGAFTLIFRRLPEGWRIIHDHSSSVPAATPEETE